MQIETTVALEHGDTKLSGTCIDLSSTGMQVLASAQLRMGDKVRVLIPSEHSELKDWTRRQKSYASASSTMAGRAWAWQSFRCPDPAPAMAAANAARLQKSSSTSRP